MINRYYVDKSIIIVHCHREGIIRTSLSIVRNPAVKYLMVKVWKTWIYQKVDRQWKTWRSLIDEVDQQLETLHVTHFII